MSDTPGGQRITIRVSRSEREPDRRKVKMKECCANAIGMRTQRRRSSTTREEEEVWMSVRVVMMAVVEGRMVRAMSDER